jgi:hypothetical protein
VRAAAPPSTRNAGCTAVRGSADRVAADLSAGDLSTAVDVLAGHVIGGHVIGGAVLTGANLTGADLGGATLTHADLTDADLTGADLTGADLGGVRRPEGAQVPDGWMVDSDTGRLKRAGQLSGVMMAGLTAAAAVTVAAIRMGCCGCRPAAFSAHDRRCAERLEAMWRPCGGRP